MNLPEDNRNEPPLLFICHAGLDHPYVARLAARLEEEGIRCWYYERDNFGQSIGSAVDRESGKTASKIRRWDVRWMESTRCLAWTCVCREDRA